MKIFLNLFFLGFIFSISAHSQVDSRFEEGLKSYQASEFEAAKNSFSELLKKYESNSVVLYNLGLAEYKLGNLGMAIAHWRKAQSQTPDLEGLSTALEIAIEKLEVKELPHKATFYENFRANFLGTFSWNQALVSAFVFTLFAFWNLLTFVRKRRLAVEQETTRPKLSTATYFLTAGFLISSTLLGFKIYDETIPRGVVVAKKVEAHSGPDESMSTVFELFEGLSVIMQESRKDWVQVTYPGGKTGWVKKDSIYKTSGRKIW